MYKLQFIDGKLEGFGFLVASSVGGVQQEIINVEVNEELYNKAKKTPDLYILVNGEVIQDPDYEEKQAQNREKEFKKQFFETSLGWVRREVTMKDGSTSIFLTDLLPLLSEGIPILVYETPDSRVDFNIVDYQKQKLTTEQFLKECKNQLIIDFYGFNPVEANGEGVE